MPKLMDGSIGYLPYQKTVAHEFDVYRVDLRPRSPHGTGCRTRRNCVLSYGPSGRVAFRRDGFVALATLAGAPTLLPDKLRDTLFVLIGLSMGAGVRPDVLERIGEWPVSMALLVVVVVSVTLAGYVVLHFGAKWSRDTAFSAPFRAH